MRLYIVALIAVIGFFTAHAASAQDVIVDGVPLPGDVSTRYSKVLDGSDFEPFKGAWAGSWGGTLNHILVVESIEADGSARVIYAYGDAPLWRISRGWNRYKAKISNQKLVVFGQGFTATYVPTKSGKLAAQFAFGGARSQAIMIKKPLTDLLKPEAKIDWVLGKSETVQTDMEEDGKPVNLEIVTFKPKGKGPFPLIVINHGSTGSGKQKAFFTQTWFDTGLADFFTERGWLVAFLQRRGRGKSDGLYDEGFSKERAQGYTCKTGRSLAGADRALADLDAAVVALQKRPDVKPGAVLVAGVSRGGALSVAYAGRHPEKVSGVVNFVGGWMGDRCKNATEINTTLLSSGAGFKYPMLWMYGRNDPFYKISHSQNNFKAFITSGGRGDFIEMDVPGGNGHLVNVIRDLWASKIDTYLREMKLEAGKN